MEEFQDSVFLGRRLQESSYDLWNLPPDVSMKEVRLLERDEPGSDDIFAIFRAKKGHLFEPESVREMNRFVS